jgi:lipid-A-disaccharide synthase
VNKLFFIAGEASGDTHAAQVIEAIVQQNPNAQIRAWGGYLMQAAGATLSQHYRDLAVMGFVEVLKKSYTLYQHLQNCKQEILDYQPDAIVLIDYGGFNLRIARFAKAHQIKVFYYIPPKVWAWNTRRVELLKRYTDRVFVIFPFEVPLFKALGLEVVYVGNPSVRSVEVFQEKHIPQSLSLKPTIALLPGSRKQEVLAHLPIFLEGIGSYIPDYQVIIVASSAVDLVVYQKILSHFCQKQQSLEIKILVDKTFEVLAESTVAVVASGTATLETALMSVPQVLAYRMHWLTARIARLLLKVRYIGLVNLIADKEVVKELIQDDLTPERIRIEIEKIERNSHKRAEILEDYQRVKESLGKQNPAKEIIKWINESNIK